MKMRKTLLSLGLTLAMVMGMSAMAHATGTDTDQAGQDTTAETTYTDMTTVDITKTYELKGEGKSPEETFTLTQDGNGTVSQSDATEAPKLEKIEDVTYAKGDAGSKNQSKAFKITLPEYEHPGLYEYTLKETDGKTAGVTYRTSAIKLVVTVIEQDGLVRVAAVHTETQDGTKTASFSDNTYTANKLIVTKQVTGNLGDKKKKFEFTVKFTGPTEKNWVNAIETTATKKENEENTYTFSLSDSEKMTFANIPAGVKYEVEETTYEGYTTSYTNQKGTMADQEITAAVTNERNGDVDTGIIMENLPYIVILAVLAVAALGFMASRRRRFE